MVVHKVVKYYLHDFNMYIRCWLIVNYLIESAVESNKFSEKKLY